MKGDSSNRSQTPIPSVTDLVSTQSDAHRLWEASQASKGNSLNELTQSGAAAGLASLWYFLWEEPPETHFSTVEPLNCKQDTPLLSSTKALPQKVKSLLSHFNLEIHSLALRLQKSRKSLPHQLSQLHPHPHPHPHPHGKPMIQTKMK